MRGSTIYGSSRYDDVRTSPEVTIGLFVVSGVGILAGTVRPQAREFLSNPPRNPPPHPTLRHSRQISEASYVTQPESGESSQPSISSSCLLSSELATSRDELIEQARTRLNMDIVNNYNFAVCGCSGTGKSRLFVRKEC